jgi:hypothetical protein
MLQLVLSCDNLLKLQAVLSIHLNQFTPSCIATAMQQLHRLRQQELQQPNNSSSSSSGDMGPVLQAVQLQLAGQMTQALLRQLPVVSGSCLAAFLSAAASMRLVMPDAVLEQIAAHLVNKALRLACQQQKQQQQHTAPAAATNQQPVATNTSSAATNQQLDGQQQQEHDSSQLRAADSTQQQPRSQPHVAALSAWALAKLKLRSGPLWSELVSIAGEQLPSMAPHDCVMLAHACARAGQHQPRLFNAVAQQLRPHAARLPPESISCLLWSYAAAGQYHQGWVSVLVSAAADKMERFSPRQLATSLWACGRLRHADTRMLSALRVQALACMSDTGHMSLSNLAWSLATLGVADEALTAAISSRAGQLAGGFHMQGLANVAWAVVKLQQQLKLAHKPQPHARVSGESNVQLRSSSSGISSSSIGIGSQQPPQSSQRQLWQSAHGLLEVLCSAAVDKVHSAQPQEVCNLLWACATLQHKHEAFFAAAAARLVVVAENAQPIDLAQAMWALETLRFRRNTTQQALLKAALNKLHLFGPQALSNLAWAVAASGMRYPPGLPEAVAQQLQALLPKMTPQGQATTLWALSKLGPVPQQLVHAASSHISAQLPMYNAHDLCNVAMVAAKAGYKEPQLLQDLAAAASSAAAVTLSTWQGSREAAGRQQSGEAPPVCSASRAPQKRLTQQGVCNLVWAFAGTGWCDTQLMQQLQRVAVLHLTRLKPRSLAALCQGFALLGQPLDELLAAMTGAAQAQHNTSKQRNQQAPSLQYQQNMQRLEARLGAVPAASELQLQAHSMMHQFASWSADSLALLLHAVVITEAQDRQPAVVLAALRLLNRRGAAESLSQQRQRQLHMALTSLALQWGVAAAGQQDRSQVMSDRSAPSNSPQIVPGAPSRMRQPSIVQQLLGDALVYDGGAGSCSATDGCAAYEQEQQHASTAFSAPAAEAPAAAQEQPGAADDLAVAPLPPSAAAHPGLDVSGLPGLAGELLTGGLAQVCLRSWQQHEAVRQLSRVEQEAARVLQSMGLQPLTQHWLQLTYTQAHSHQARGAAAVVAQWTSRALAVNVGLAAPALGPGRSPLALCVLPSASLSSSWPRQVLGQTRLELSCLQAAGWQVVELSWEEWDSLGGNIASQQELLRRLCGL